MWLFLSESGYRLRQKTLLILKKSFYFWKCGFCVYAAVWKYAVNVYYTI